MLLTDKHMEGAAMNLANLITVLRFPLLLLVVALLYLGGAAGQFIDVGLIALLILMDSAGWHHCPAATRDHTGRDHAGRGGRSRR